MTAAPEAEFAERLTLDQHVSRLSGLVPRDQAGKMARIRRRLPWRKPADGLTAIPERYRLEFLRLAAAQLRQGSEGAEIRALADRMADGVTVPKRLAKQSDPRPLDAWFRAQAPRIKILAATLGAERRAA